MSKKFFEILGEIGEEADDVMIKETAKEAEKVAYQYSEDKHLDVYLSILFFVLLEDIEATIPTTKKVSDPKIVLKVTTYVISEIFEKLAREFDKDYLVFRYRMFLLSIGVHSEFPEPENIIDPKMN